MDSVLIEHLGRGLMDMLILSMPCVLVAAFIGLIVGILQAVTQVQEQTIAAAPKILGVFLLIMMMSGFFMNVLSEYTKQSFDLAFNYVTKNDTFVLPPEKDMKKPLKEDEVMRGRVSKQGRGADAFGLSKNRKENYGSDHNPHAEPNFMESASIRRR